MRSTLALARRPRVPESWNFDYISASAEVVFGELKTAAEGLTEKEARRRCALYGPNEVVEKRRTSVPLEILKRFVNPLVMLLIAIAIFSFVFGDRISTVIVMLMVAMSVTLSFVQERRAEAAAARLTALVHTTAAVYRDGRPHEKPIKEIVPGDVILFAAGDLVPADLRLVETNDLFVNQAALTGEALPVQKNAAGAATAEKESPEFANLVFMGSSVVSGTGRGVVIHTGAATEFGRLAGRLVEKTETLFDRQIRDFVWLMIRLIFIIVAAIALIYFFKNRNLLEALLYALAVAVQITPETLPMIVTINLSKGALDMAKKKVIVKHLSSIQNFGAMDVFCSDKTGTLTMDKVVLERHVDPTGRESEAVLHFGYLNSYYQTGLRNLLDQAVLKHEHIALNGWRKAGEIPFDFIRKIMSVVVRADSGALLIAKGAPEEILKRCEFAEIGGHVAAIAPADRAGFEAVYRGLNARGFRVLAVAYRKISREKSVYRPEDEAGLALKGFMAFFDPPKPTARRTVESLERLGIAVKILTGDHELVTGKICEEIGFEAKRIVTGEEVERLNDLELGDLVETINVFARVLPLQKERIIRTLRKNGHTVGFLGDGINDAPALKAADVGISVNNAVDIAKESASIILLEKNLAVLYDGVLEGRRVFGNFVKYIRLTSMVNVSYMLTTVLAGFVLPFLPMAPVQILLNNYLYEVGQIAIPSDKVDRGYLTRPRRWDINQVFRFMLAMGPLGTLFDFATFGALWFVFAAGARPALFQTGWFLEATLAQLLLIYVLRTRQIPFFQSWPSRLLILTSAGVLAVVFALPFTVFAAPLGLVRPPLLFYPVIAGIVLVYLAAAWAAKNLLLARLDPDAVRA